MVNLFKKISKNAWTNFTRNLGISIATCFIIGMTIFLFTSLFLMREVGSFIIDSLENKVDISVYFKEEAKEEDILILKDELSQTPEIKNVEYISQEEALDRFIQRYKDDATVIESLEEVGNPLLPSLNIKAWQASQYSDITAFLENSSQKELINKIDYFERKPVIERIYSITANINTIGLFFSIVLAIVSVLVAFNQVRLAIYNSRGEIKIQRLVGASNWFIKGPFLIQGAISGIIAAFASFIIFILTVYFLNPKFIVLFPELNIFNFLLNNFGIFFLLHISIGIVLGISSSIFAIRRFLED